jgi:replicative DNA helicase
MRKILYNHSFYGDKDLDKELLYLYETSIKLSGFDKDIYDILQFSIDYYYSEDFFPSQESVLEKFNSFQFIDEKFTDKEDFRIYIKNKQVFYRDKLRQELIIDYMNNKDDREKRLYIINEITKLEASISSSDRELKDTSTYDYKEMYNVREHMGTGPKTNIDDIDCLIGGFTAGKIMVVAAPPGCFKTSFSINFITCGLTEYEEENNTLVLSLELPPNEMYWKIIKRYSYKEKWGVDIKAVLKGLLADSEKEQLFNIVEKFNKDLKSKLYIQGLDDIGHNNSIIELRQQLIGYIEKYNIKTIVIDYMQIFKSLRFSGYKDEYAMQNDVVIMLHVISSIYNTRIMLLSQMNRDGIKKANKNGGRFSMENLAEVNALERYGYYIVTLFANQELKSSNQFKFQLLKHRDGFTIEEPKCAFVIPEYFVLGRNDEFTFDKMVGIDESKIENSTDNFLDLELFS